MNQAVRPGAGAHGDRRTKRRRTRGAQLDAELKEQAASDGREEADVTGDIDTLIQRFLTTDVGILLVVRGGRISPATELERELRDALEGLRDDLAAAEKIIEAARRDHRGPYDCPFAPDPCEVCEALDDWDTRPRRGVSS